MQGAAATTQASAAKDTQQQWLDACEFALTQPTGSNDVVDVDGIEGEDDVPSPDPKPASPSDPNIFAVVDYVCKGRDDDDDGDALQCDLRIYLVPFFPSATNHHSTLNAIRPDYVVCTSVCFTLFFRTEVYIFDTDLFRQNCQYLIYASKTSIALVITIIGLITSCTIYDIPLPDHRLCTTQTPATFDTSKCSALKTNACCAKVCVNGQPPRQSRIRMTCRLECAAR